jgi:hypothetical protein
MTDASANTPNEAEAQEEETKSILVKVPQHDGVALKVLAAINDTTVQALVAAQVAELVKRNQKVLSNLFSAKSA